MAWPLAFLFAFVIVEGLSYGLSRAYYGFVAEESIPELREYMRRPHPLFTDNGDLRTRSNGLDYAPFVGVRFAPDTVHTRIHPDFTSRIEIDAEGFVHTGDKEANTKLFAEPNVYRIAFFGGSTTVGRSASNNLNTIPALFEKRLKARWPDRTFQVINAGVFGYQSTQKRMMYSMYIKQHHPQLIVFLDGDNDAEIANNMERWAPHYEPMMDRFMNVEKYRQIFSPGWALSQFVRNALSFPETTYTLALLRRVLSRVEGDPALPSKGYFHPEAVAQLQDNLRAVALKALYDNTASLFVLQPILTLHKPIKAPHEEAIIKATIARMPNYEDSIARYFLAFREVYTEVNGKSQTPMIRAIDLTRLFENEPRFIYESRWHYNDLGNRILADRLFDEVEKMIATTLTPPS